MNATPFKEDLLEACFREVQLACHGRNLVVERLGANRAGWIGVQLQGSSRAWDLFVECDETLLALPRLLLDAPRPLLAHVSHGGLVCVNDGQGLSLESDRYPEIVAYTVLAGYDLLEKSMADATAGSIEFFNELEGYWQGLPDALRGRATIEIDGRSRSISAYSDASHQSPKWYFTESGLPVPPEFHAGKLAAQRAVYLHLDNCPAPPAHPEKLGTAFIQAVAAKLTIEQLELWDRFLKPSKNSRKQLVVLISCPRHSGGLSLIGCVFSAHGGVIDPHAEVIPLTARRHSPAYMRERGGAAMHLMHKHIAILGCGAVGSAVADALAASGVGRLTLVDHDDYSEDNIFRHILGPEWIDRPKVVGLQHELTRRFPGVQITAVPTVAQAWLKKVPLGGLDGIVIALGAPSLERSLARHLRSRPISLPVVLTWLEALDLGGHSVLVHTNGEGCLDCLYRDEEGQSVLYPRTSFLEPGQHVSRNLTGCTSIFVPFGALQARRTALMAAEHMIGALQGDTGPSYKYWVGDGTAAVREDLQTTNWWATAQARPIDQTAQVFGHPCKRCRGST